MYLEAQAEDLVEGPAKLLVEAGVNDRIESGVEIAEPEEEGVEPAGHVVADEDAVADLDRLHDREYEEGQPAEREAAHDDAEGARGLLILARVGLSGRVALDARDDAGEASAEILAELLHVVGVEARRRARRVAVREGQVSRPECGGARAAAVRMMAYCVSTAGRKETTTDAHALVDGQIAAAHGRAGAVLE